MGGGRDTARKEIRGKRWMLRSRKKAVELRSHMKYAHGVLGLIIKLDVS